MDKETIIALTADIVSAHVGNNTTSAAELPNLIASIFDALTTVGEPAPQEEEKREPAVSIRASVKPDVITCLDCGKKLKMLKKHLSADHGLTPAEYRQRWQLASDYPMVAQNYANQRKELALKIGLGRKPAQGRKRGRKPRATAQQSA